MATEVRRRIRFHGLGPEPCKREESWVAENRKQAGSMRAFIHSFFFSSLDYGCGQWSQAPAAETSLQH